MKRLFAAFAALLFILCMVSCGKKNDDKESFSQSDTSSTDLTQSETQDVIALSSDTDSNSGTTPFTTKTDSKQNSSAYSEKSESPVNSDSTTKKQSNNNTNNTNNTNNINTTENSITTTGKVQLADGDEIDYGWY